MLTPLGLTYFVVFFDLILSYFWFIKTTQPILTLFWLFISIITNSTLRSSFIAFGDSLFALFNPRLADRTGSRRPSVDRGHPRRDRRRDRGGDHDRRGRRAPRPRGRRSGHLSGVVPGMDRPHGRGLGDRRVSAVMCLEAIVGTLFGENGKIEGVANLDAVGSALFAEGREIDG